MSAGAVLAFGEHKYGERKALFEEGGPLENMNFDTVKNCGWVARSVTTSFRNDVLSFAHHYHVASLPPVQQKKWLARAVKEGWSPNDATELRLYAELRAGELLVKMAERGERAKPVDRLARGSAVQPREAGSTPQPALKSRSATPKLAALRITGRTALPAPTGAAHA